MRLQDLKSYYLEELKERIEERYVITNDDCWEYMGGRTVQGYGKVSVKQSTKPAHRVYYQLVKGFLPDNLVMHHLCENPPCINPAHLEPVTLWGNTLKSDNIVAQNAKKTHCAKGHPFDGENLTNYVSSRGKRYRGCRTCSKARVNKNSAERTNRNHAIGLTNRGRPMSDKWKRKYGLI